MRNFVTKLFRYGFPRPIVRLSFAISWPIIILGKKLSGLPALEWIINPLFSLPHSQLTAVPIRNIAVDESIPETENMVMPITLVERLLKESPYIFIHDHCVCRVHMGITDCTRDIGCITIGKAATKIHPSNGHMATVEGGIAHVRKAAKAGLVANIAHVWIDPVGFAVPTFRKMFFICFCAENACLYTDHLKRHCSSFDKAYKRLPGIRTEVDVQRCTGCGICEDKCFVAAIRMVDGKAVIGQTCKACGRCVNYCPSQAIAIHMDDEDAVFDNLMKRIGQVADIKSA